MTYVRTIKSHQQTAKQLRDVRIAISRLNNQVFGRFPVSHPVQRLLAQLNSQASKLTSALDDDWHCLVDDEDAKKYGNIYYTDSDEATPDVTSPLSVRGTGLETPNTLFIRCPVSPSSTTGRSV